MTDKKKTKMTKYFLIFILSIVSICFNVTSKGGPVLFYETCFTPPQKCGDLIVEHINNGKHSIFVQAYGFTSKKIIDALVDAKNRGLQIEIILDRSNFHKNKQPVLDLLKNNKIIVYKDKASGIAHNKIMIIDGDKVLTGSFNFTANADKRNAENVIVIYNKDIAKEYYKNWEKRKL